MNQADHPRRFPIPFANGAGGSYIRSIPEAHQAASPSDAPASLEDGFPPECFTPEGSGGVPPSGKDFNGILHDITDELRWLQAGGPALYDEDFSTANSGYPKGARLASSVTPGVEWISSVNGNTTDPDSESSANWIRVGKSESLLATNGYEIRSSGLVDMWGQIYIGQDTSAAVTYPLGGLTAVYNVQITWVDSNVGSGSDMDASGISSPSLSGFTIYNDGAARTHHWRALGVK